MAQVRIYHNAACLKCDVLKKRMMMVGPMVFCKDCLRTEFLNNGLVSVNEREQEVVDTKSKKYIYWIQKYKDQCLNPEPDYD